jgi:hypothetical protein
MSVSIVANGIDKTSLFGSVIKTNDQFMFISANGYDNFNGMVVIYKKMNIEKHSVLYSPDKSNVNFGFVMDVNNNYLVVGGIKYNLNKGVIYIYKYTNNVWSYYQDITDRINVNPFGFGYKIEITNSNKIIVVDYSSSIYLYNIRKKFALQNFIKHQNKDGKQVVHSSIVVDKFDNIIFSQISKKMHIINSLGNSTLMFNIEIDQCYYGSNLFIYDIYLYISCSNYYPFKPIQYNKNSKIYIYEIVYNSNNIISFHFKQIIFNPNQDIYFGINIDANDKYLFISGNKTIYHYEQSNNNWIYLNKYEMPDSYVNYDYKIKIIDNSVIIGNYGGNNLSGAIYKLNYNVRKNNDEVQNIENHNFNEVGDIYIKLLIIITLVLIGTGFITIMCCSILCVAKTSDPKKKKKKTDETYSPYNVHSYLGYVETDDQIQYINENIHYVNHHIANNRTNQFSSQSFTSLIEEGMAQHIKKKKTNVGFEKMSKEQVVSYKEYFEFQKEK